MDKYKRLDVAIDAYYTDPNQFGSSSASRRTETEKISRLNALFDKYKGTKVLGRLKLNVNGLLGYQTPTGMTSPLMEQSSFARTWK